jgi:hypothetical protein
MARSLSILRPVEKGSPMEDLPWIALTLGLLALTLAYVRLCEKA